MRASHTNSEFPRIGGVERVERTLEDLRVEVDRDKVMVGDDVFDFRDGVIEQINIATAATAAQQPYAYIEWLRVAALCVKQAYKLGTGQGMGGDIYR